MCKFLAFWCEELVTEQLAREAGGPAEKNIVGTAYWYKGRIDGENFFAIYSTEDSSGPTILYEVKGKMRNKN